MTTLAFFRRYRLTAPALEALRASPLEAGTVQKLQPMLNVAFTKREFLSEAKRLGVAQEPASVAPLMRCADRLTVSRLSASFRSQWERFIAGSRYVLPVWSYLALRPVPFSLLFRSRLFYLTRMARGAGTTKELQNVNTVGFEHNRKQIGEFLPGHRERTERLAIVMRCISGLDLESARTLCVGPRNEAEVLLLQRYGFGDVSAIDLFSYSPLIDVMDMNDLRFADDRFDVYYSSFVLGYSPDVERTLAEALRVTRSGGIHVFGWTSAIAEDRYGLTPEGSDIQGFEAFEARFGRNIEHVYWKDCHDLSDQRVYTIIYRTRKP